MKIKKKSMPFASANDKVSLVAIIVYVIVEDLMECMVGRVVPNNIQTEQFSILFGIFFSWRT